MQEPDEKLVANDRRMHPRCSVYGFMHATASLSDSAETGRENQDQMQYCTGLLADISHEGAQINMPDGCHKYLKEDQNVIVRIKTTFTEKMDFDVPAQVKYVVQAKNANGLLVGINFADLAAHHQAETAILKMCEFGRKLKAVGEKQAEQMTSADN